MSGAPAGGFIVSDGTIVAIPKELYVGTASSGFPNRARMFGAGNIGGTGVEQPVGAYPEECSFECIAAVRRLVRCLFRRYQRDRLHMDRRTLDTIP